MKILPVALIIPFLISFAFAADAPPAAESAPMTTADLKIAAEKITAQYWNTQYDRYVALAKLIKPGNTVAQLKLVLPMGFGATHSATQPAARRAPATSSDGTITLDPNTDYIGGTTSMTGGGFGESYDLDHDFQIHVGGHWGGPGAIDDSNKIIMNGPEVAPRDYTWSDEVDCLRLQLTGSSTIAKRVGMEVSVFPWNFSKENLAFCIDDPHAFTWQVYDEHAHLIKPETLSPDNNIPNPRWEIFIPMQNSPGRTYLRQDKNIDGQLRIGSLLWKLPPGKYSLHGTFSGPSDAPDRPKNVHLWQGIIDLKPLAFTVYPDSNPAELQAAVDKINAQKWNTVVARYVALANLIHPGMTTDDLERVFSSDGKHIGGMEFWSGVGFMLSYSLDENYSVEADGFRAADGTNDKIITSFPRIVSNTYRQKPPP